MRSCLHLRSASPVMLMVMCALALGMVSAAWGQMQARASERSEGWLVDFGQPSSTIPDTYSAHLRLGQDLMQQGDLEGAAREFLECMRLFQPYVAAREVYGDYKDRQIMETYYQPLATASVNLGHALRGMGRLDQAIKLYTGAADIAPGFAAAHESLGRALVDKGIARHQHLAAGYRDIGLVPPDETELNLYRSAVTHLHVARQLDPQNAGVRIALSHALRRWGVLDSAVVQAQHATQLDPRNPEAHRAHALALLVSGQAEGAVSSLRDAARLAAARPTAEQAEIQSFMGVALAAVGDFDGALAAHRRAVSLDPHSSIYQNNLGAMLRTTGRAAEAAPAHVTAAGLDPNRTEFHLNQAVVARETGDLNGAIMAYRRALRLHPEDPAIHHQLALTLLRRADATRALETFGNAVSRDITDSVVEEALAHIAVHFMSERRLRMVDAMDPRGYDAIPRLLVSPSPWPGVKNTLARQWMLLDQAPLYGDLRLRLQDTVVDFESLFPALLGGSARWDTIIEAVAHGRAAATLAEVPEPMLSAADPRSPLAASGHVLAPEVKEAVVGAAIALQRADDLAEAEAELRWASRLDPRNPHILNNLGRVSLDRGNPREALKVLRQSLDITTDIAEVHLNAGIAKAELGDMSGAMAAWQRAIDHGMEGARLYTYLGIGHLQHTELDRAEAMLRRAIRLDDGYAPAHYYLGLLTALRQSASPITRELLAQSRVRTPLGEPHYQVRAELIKEDALGEAIECLRRADQADPDRREVYHYVGIELGIPDPASGVEGLDVIHNVGAGKGFIRDWAALNNNIGAVEAMSGNHTRAETLLRAAIHDEPYYALPHWNLGRVLTATGRDGEGREMMARAASLAQEQGLPYYFGICPDVVGVDAPMPREAAEKMRFKTLGEAFNVPDPVL